MAKLSKQESLDLGRLVVRAMNKIKGNALDHGRVAISNDRQFDQFTKFLKSSEQGVRAALFSALADLGIAEPLDQMELERLK